MLAIMKWKSSGGNRITTEKEITSQNRTREITRPKIIKHNKQIKEKVTLINLKILFGAWQSVRLDFLPAKNKR